MWNEFLSSPYALAFFVGIYPLAFYFSKNWFIFSSGRSLFIFWIFALLIFGALSFYYLGLSWTFKKLRAKSFSPILFQQMYVLGTILTLAYLLRHTLQEFSGIELLVPIFLIFVVLGLGWVLPKRQFFCLNTFLLIFCMLNIGNTLYSMLNTKGTTSFLGKGRNEERQTAYDQITFLRKPNVYYVVPDGYPNQKALKEIFDFDNTTMYHRLESLGFRIQHHAFSNYRSTLPSLSSLLGMQHHYYRGSIGNFEMLSSREFIVSEENPVVRIFKSNDYQVHYVHERDTIFAKGCFIDLCSPESYWDDFIDILIPGKVQGIPFIANAIGRTPEASMERVLHYIDKASSIPKNHFTYIHLNTPSHSPTTKQTREDLASFRKEYFKKIQITNAKITKILERIFIRDPHALIILNADHGAWGLGAYKWAQMEVFEGLPDDLITLDHLGVLLAIHWPENNTPEFKVDIRTNINLFRYIFAYLSKRSDILSTKVPDDGYLTRGRGKNPILVKAVDDGKILKQMLEMGPLK